MKQAVLVIVVLVMYDQSWGQLNLPEMPGPPYPDRYGNNRWGVKYDPKVHGHGRASSGSGHWRGNGGQHDFPDEAPPPSPERYPSGGRRPPPPRPKWNSGLKPLVSSLSKFTKNKRSRRPQTSGAGRPLFDSTSDSLNKNPYNSQSIDSYVKNYMKTYNLVSKLPSGSADLVNTQNFRPTDINGKFKPTVNKPSHLNRIDSPESSNSSNSSSNSNNGTTTSLSESYIRTARYSEQPRYRTLNPQIDFFGNTNRRKSPTSTRTFAKTLSTVYNDYKPGDENSSTGVTADPSTADASDAISNSLAVPNDSVVPVVRGYPSSTSGPGGIRTLSSSFKPLSYEDDSFSYMSGSLPSSLSSDGLSEYSNSSPMVIRSNGDGSGSLGPVVNTYTMSDPPPPRPPAPKPRMRPLHSGPYAHAPPPPPRPLYRPLSSLDLYEDDSFSYMSGSLPSSLSSDGPYSSISEYSNSSPMVIRSNGDGSGTLGPVVSTYTMSDSYGPRPLTSHLSSSPFTSYIVDAPYPPPPPPPPPSPKPRMRPLHSGPYAHAPPPPPRPHSRRPPPPPPPHHFSPYAPAPPPPYSSPPHYHKSNKSKHKKKRLQHTPINVIRDLFGRGDHYDKRERPRGAYAANVPFSVPPPGPPGPQYPYSPVANTLSSSSGPGPADYYNGPPGPHYGPPPPPPPPPSYYPSPINSGISNLRDSILRERPFRPGPPPSPTASSSNLNNGSGNREVGPPKGHITQHIQDWPRIFTAMGSSVDAVAGGIHAVRKEISKVTGKAMAKGIMMGGSAVHEVSKGMANVITKMSTM